MKKLLLLLVILLFASNAWGFSYQNFTLDLGDDTYEVQQDLKVGGTSVIFSDFNGTYTLADQVGTFTETSTFQFNGYDSAAAQFAIDDYDFTAVFEGEGNIFDDGTDQWFEFTGGTMTMYLQDYDAGVNYNTGAEDGVFMGADDGTEIAVWNLTGGGGELTTLFAPTDGIITGYFYAYEIQPGYFFQDGQDLSAWDLESGVLLTLGYAHVTTTDWTPPGYPDPFAQEVYEYLAGGTYGTIYPNDTDPTGDGKLTLYETHGGSFELRVVPEPTTFMLFGIGLLSIAGIGRRKA